MKARLLALVLAAAGLAACSQPTATTTASSTATPVSLETSPPPMTSKPDADTRQVNISDSDRQQLEQLIKQYLDNSASANAGGFNATDIGDEIVPLQPGAEYNWVVNLHGGVAYRIIGACDNECRNIDFVVTDSSGQSVGEDTAPDDVPIVNLTPGGDASYTVRMIMRTCTIAPCFMGARVLQGASGGGKLNAKP